MKTDDMARTVKMVNARRKGAALECLGATKRPLDEYVKALCVLFSAPGYEGWHEWTFNGDHPKHGTPEHSAVDAERVKFRDTLMAEAARPMLDSMGNKVLDSDGNPVPVKVKSAVNPSQQWQAKVCGRAEKLLEAQRIAALPAEERAKLNVRAGRQGERRSPEQRARQELNKLHTYLENKDVLEETRKAIVAAIATLPKS